MSTEVNKSTIEPIEFRLSSYPHLTKTKLQLPLATDTQWHHGQAEEAAEQSVNVRLSKNCPKIIFSRNFCSTMQNLGLKIPILREFRSQITNLSD